MQTNKLLPKVTKVKVTFRCDEEDKPKIPGSSCVLHVSVGQEYHEGEKLLATLDLVNENFHTCHLVLCDTLQRHSLRIQNPTLSHQEAYKKALALGDEWLERNEAAYQYLSINWQLTRWDDWLYHPAYGQYRQEIDHLYLNNQAYQSAVHQTILKFLKRQNLLDDQRAFDLCKTYILEECPILVPLWALTGAQFVVYPRFRTPAMAATHQHFLGNNEEALLKELALKFNKRVVPKRLSFSYMNKELME